MEGLPPPTGSAPASTTYSVSESANVAIFRFFPQILTVSSSCSTLLLSIHLNSIHDKFEILFRTLKIFNFLQISGKFVFEKPQRHLVLLHIEISNIFQPQMHQEP